MQSRTWAAGAMGIGALIAVVTVVAGPVAAQDDPYGSTTTTTAQPSPEVTCELELTSGESGASVTANVHDVEGGATVRILFDGSEVARGTAAASETTTSLAIRFQVPDVEPGTYLVSAVGAEFTVTCGTESSRGFEVLGSTFEQGGSSSLPKTGVTVTALALLGAALVAIGRVVLRRSRAATTLPRE